MQIDIPANVKLIFDILQNEGYQAYIYGACIRDTLLGRKPLNWDITTNALPSDVIMIFDDRRGFSAIPALHDHSAVMLIHAGESYRVTTFRTGKENRFSDDIEEELKQHDFTINSLAYNEHTGLLDLFGGVDDINHKTLRCAANAADLIKEDHVRILRAVRFEAQLGFRIDDSLLRVIKGLKNEFYWQDYEKVCNELTQILLSDRPSASIRRMLEFGLLEHLIPELIPTVGFDTRSSFHDQAVFDHTMTVLDNTKASLNVRLAALFHDIAKPACLTVDEDGEGHCYGHAAKGSQMAEAVLTRLNFDHKTVAAVGAIIKEHMNNYDNISELSIKRLIRRVGPANIDDLFDLQLADIKGSGLSGRDSHWIELVRNRCWEVMSRREPLTTHDLNISGYDLMFLYDTNREMGEALEYLLDRVIDNPALNEKETLLALLKQRS